MANQYKNKVVYDGNVLIDLTGDTITAENVIEGYTFHGADGSTVQGALTHLTDAEIDEITGGSGGGYIRTEVCPQQTVTPDSSRTVSFTATTPFVDGEYYVVTYDGTEYVVTAETLWTDNVILGDAQVVWQTTDVLYPFALITTATASEGYFTTTSAHTVKVERLEFTGDATILSSKSITANGTYNASSDSADGYASVTVNVPSSSPTLQAKTAMPTTSQQTIAPDSGYDGLSSVTVNAIPSEYIVPSGTKAITANGTGIDVAQYASVDVAVPSCWELIASTTLTNIARTSTSAATAGTIALGSSAFTATDMIWVHIRDTEGPRANYFYGSDSLFVNANKANNTTTTFTAPAIETIRCTTAGALAGYSGGYGVWGYSISSSGSLTVRMRYNSNYSLTIDGDYKVDVYRLTPPNGIVLFPE